MLQRIIVHWTGGTNRASNHDKECYHFLIQGDGTVVHGVFTPEDNLKTGDGKYAAHTLKSNTGSIGVAVCGMLGAVESPFDAGKFPITALQWGVLVNVVTGLCKRYGIPVTPKTVLSHAEVGANLGIPQRAKWDISRLPFALEVKGAKAVGDKLRSEVAAKLSAKPLPKQERLMAETPVAAPAAADPVESKGFFQSRTVRWIIAGLVAYAIRMLGIPALSPDMSAEIVNLITYALDAFIPGSLFAAMAYRKQAKVPIKGLV